MSEKVFDHDSDAVLDYTFDWTDWLGAGETITSKTIVPSSGITVDSSTLLAGVVTVWVSHATKPVQRVTCRIVTSAGRTDDRTIKLNVKDR